MFTVAGLMCIAATWVMGCSSRQPVVEQFGGMREVMREGQMQPRIRLADIAVDSGTIAVGALAELQGEITIVNGGVWVARPDGSGVQVTGPQAQPGDDATLLAVSQVAAWRAVMIPEPLEGQALESFIEQAAGSLGLDTDEPFPFVIEGGLTSLNMHVIHGYCPIATDPTTMEAQPYRYTSDATIEGVIAGFYARGAAGVLTHHGTSAHMHALFEDGDRTVTGHIESVGVAGGAVLRVPDVR